MNVGTYRRARQAYLSLPPRDRVGMTPERLASIIDQPSAPLETVQ